MKLTYRLLQGDYVRALTPSAVPYLVLFGLAAALSMGILYGFGTRSPVLYAVAALAVFAFGYRAHPAFMLRRRYQTDKALQSPLTVEGTDRGLLFSSSLGELKLPWRDIVSWRIRAGAIVISVMPWHCFERTKPVESDQLVMLGQYVIPLSSPDLTESSRKWLIDHLTHHVGPPSPLLVMARPGGAARKH